MLTVQRGKNNPCVTDVHNSAKLISKCSLSHLIGFQCKKLNIRRRNRLAIVEPLPISDIMRTIVLRPASSR